jgi:hypothetical protein
MRRGSSGILLMHFYIMPQHVSARHCHYQGIVVSSEKLGYIPRQLTTLEQGHPKYRLLE